MFFGNYEASDQCSPGGSLKMADDDKHTLDLSKNGLKKLEKRDGIGIQKLILDNNELLKLEHLDCFPDLEKLSAKNNCLTRMYGVSKLHYLISLSLSHNNIISIEGLKELHSLTWLDLAGNKIKLIQNLQHNRNIIYLDLSDNNIESLGDISHLEKLKTLHLNGNHISSLHGASSYLPPSICILSLADNNLSDLNEISHLSSLTCLEHLTVNNNPCIVFTGQTVGFDYRPFVVNWCLGVRVLDNYVVTQRESLKAEWLFSQGKGRHFRPGEHMELVEYLAHVCPLTSVSQMSTEEEERLTRVLKMKRQHKEQLLHELSTFPGASENDTATTQNPSQQWSLRKEFSQPQNSPSPTRSKKTNLQNSCTDQTPRLNESFVNNHVHHCSNIQSQNTENAVTYKEKNKNLSQTPSPTSEQIWISNSPRYIGDITQNDTSSIPVPDIVASSESPALNPLLNNSDQSPRLNHQQDRTFSVLPTKSPVTIERFLVDNRTLLSDQASRTKAQHQQYDEKAESPVSPAIKARTPYQQYEDRVVQRVSPIELQKYVSDSTSICHPVHARVSSVQKLTNRKVTRSVSPKMMLSSQKHCTKNITRKTVSSVHGSSPVTPRPQVFHSPRRSSTKNRPSSNSPRNSPSKDKFGTRMKPRDSSIRQIYANKVASPRHSSGQRKPKPFQNGSQQLQLMTQTQTIFTSQAPLTTATFALNNVDDNQVLISSNIGHLTSNSIHLDNNSEMENSTSHQRERNVHDAATKIQALWKGYHTRNFSAQGVELRHELRLRRMEDHILSLQQQMHQLMELCVSQQQELYKEKEQRLQLNEDIVKLKSKFQPILQDTTKVEKVDSAVQTSPHHRFPFPVISSEPSPAQRLTSGQQQQKEGTVKDKLVKTSSDDGTAQVFRNWEQGATSEKIKLCQMKKLL
ncbi:centrosomal protein 97kDa isoform X2 [Tachypleus tridentatus]|uniref:centrosomal protein 97kDa isoform X2 n=1 Tax=Tachypleus tridentatus TaxID=6853 RepID=UPI003FD19241